MWLGMKTNRNGPKNFISTSIYIFFSGCKNGIGKCEFENKIGKCRYT